MIKNHTVLDMYRYWCKQKVESSSEYYLKYDHCRSIKGIYILYERSFNGPDKQIMNYGLFRTIIELYNRRAIEFIIEGYELNLGSSLGYLFPATVERSFSRPKVDVHATLVARKKEADHPPIYFMTQEYSLVRWRKRSRLRNESVYVFRSAGSGKKCKNLGLKRSFSKALVANPILSYNYKYYGR